MIWTLLGRAVILSKENSICKGMEVWNLVCHWNGGQWEGIDYKCLLIHLGRIGSSLSTPYPYLSHLPSPYTSLIFCFSVGNAGTRRLGGPGCRGPCATFYLPSPGPGTCH